MSLRIQAFGFQVRGDVGARMEEGDPRRRRGALKRVDRELSKGNYKMAVSVVKQLQGSGGGLRGFGAAKQVPKRIVSLDDLKLSQVEISSLRSLLHSILDSIQTAIQFLHSQEVEELLKPESLMHGESYDSQCEDHLKCVQHEAGHFLVGYLLGVLPKGYRINSMDTLKQDISGGRVEFLGFELLREVYTATKSKYKFNRGRLCDGANKRKISSKTLDRFLCVILGGLVAEHLVFGCSIGLHSDVEKLDKVLKWLDLTDDEADSQVKWAALNTVLILDRHLEARSRLAEAMALGRSVGFCIDTIESTLNDKEI